MPVDHVNGVELYWEQRGSGPRLLFCNGSGTTLQAVRPLLDLVAARFDLLAWDYRGLGRSVPVTGPYTMADLAADAAGLLEVAGWDICRVLGVSFGGMVAQEFAVTNADFHAGRSGQPGRLNAWRQVGSPVRLPAGTSRRAGYRRCLVLRGPGSGGRDRLLLCMRDDAAGCPVCLIRRGTDRDIRAAGGMIRAVPGCPPAGSWRGMLSM
jgi:pimeloyl-ACP methyl ester carboxylesterase